jgi:hypothetical protein
MGQVFSLLVFSFQEERKTGQRNLSRIFLPFPEN